MKKIIAISGKAGSGKDTIFETIQKTKGVEKKVAFADKLKKVSSAFVGVSEIDKNETYTTARGEMTGRELLQIIATEVFRNNFHENVWAVAVSSTIEDIFKKNDLVVVTDLRFNNEAEELIKIAEKCDARLHFIRVGKTFIRNNRSTQSCF